MKIRRFFVAAVGVAVAVACGVDALDLTGKQCPCTEGYVCDTSTNTCVTSLTEPLPDATPADTGVDAPKPDASGAIIVSNLRAVYVTANTIRWEWRAFGDPAKFARYEIITGASAEAVRARLDSTRKFEVAMNPELGFFVRPGADAAVPVSLWSITDGHKEGELVFAQVVAYDTDGVPTMSDVASDTTSRPRNTINIYLDGRPDGGAFEPAAATTKIVPDIGFDASCLEHTVTCQGTATCEFAAGMSSIELLNVKAITSVTEYNAAFLELAVRGENVPGEFIDVILHVGNDGCVNCRMRFSGLSFRKPATDWRVLQIPLNRFREADGDGGTISHAQLSNRDRIAAFLVSAEAPNGAKIGLDQARIRW